MLLFCDCLFLAMIWLLFHNAAAAELAIVAVSGDKYDIKLVCSLILIIYAIHIHHGQLNYWLSIQFKGNRT